jgi:drug/metabolite transporter (DMT)-like permease
VKPLVIFLCCLVQAFLVIGQLFLKRAMSSPKIGWKWFFLGIGNFTLWFFIWLGVLKSNDLSQVFPFEGLNAALVAIAAAWLLKEKMTARGWIGIALISAGIMLVSQS